MAKAEVEDSKKNSSEPFLFEDSQRSNAQD
ncbi:unnamed protein product [Victoria cruziana]